MKKVPGSNYNVGDTVYFYQGGQFTAVKMTETMKSGFVYVISTDGAYDKANADKPM